MKAIKIIFSLLVLSTLIFSCNAEVKMNVRTASNGNLDLDIKLDPILVQYIFDLQSAFTNVSPEEAKELFDPAKAKTEIEKSKTVKVLSMDSSKKNQVKMQLAFNPLQEVVNEGNQLIEKQVQNQIRNIMDLKVGKDGVKTATFHLDKENFNSLVDILPEEAKALVGLFAPPGYKVEKEEYLEVLKLNFIEYDAAHIGEEIVKSKFRLNATFEGQILSATGAKVKGNSAVVEVSLLDLLLLNEPFEFEVKFK